MKLEECLIITGCVIGILFILSCVVSNELVIYDVAKTIQTNENLSKSVLIDVWIVKHEWRSDWYVIGYKFEVPNYMCNEQEKETIPWYCSKIPYSTTFEYIWFNTKTKEVHDAWREIF